MQLAKEPETQTGQSIGSASPLRMQYLAGISGSESKNEDWEAMYHAPQRELRSVASLNRALAGIEVLEARQL